MLTVVPVAMSSSLLPFTKSLILFPWQQNRITYSLHNNYKSHLSFTHCKFSINSNLCSFQNYPTLYFWGLGFDFSENKDDNFPVWANPLFCTYLKKTLDTIYSYNLFYLIVTDIYNYVFLDLDQNKIQHRGMLKKLFLPVTTQSFPELYQLCEKVFIKIQQKTVKASNS